MKLPHPSGLAARSDSLPNGDLGNNDSRGGRGDASISDAGSDGPLSDGPNVNLNRSNVFISDQELAVLRRLVEQRLSPWYLAFETVRSAANTALTMPPRSVAANGGGILWKTDHVNSANYPNRTDYLSARAVSHAVRDLGLTYRLTNDSRYAQKAVELLRVWCVDSSTAMKPSTRNYGPATPGRASGGSDEIALTIPALLYGATLVWNAAEWPRSERDTFLNWVKQFIVEAIPHAVTAQSYWPNLLLAALAVTAGDESALQSAFEVFRGHIEHNSNEQGQLLTFSDKRPLGVLSTAINNLVALVGVAEVARHLGVDLYAYRAPNGRSLQDIANYHAPHATDSSSWPGLADLTAEKGAAAFELTYSIWQSPTHKAAVERWGRPIEETYSLGITTFTHAERFAWPP